MGKHPRTEHGFRDATTDAATIRAWWKRWPDANVGIATGEGLFVLDVDPGKDGPASLQELEREHGPLPPTLAAISGSDGTHYYFSAPSGARCSVAKRQGIDTRGEGGYIVAPPSLHSSGQYYEWADGHDPETTLLAPVPPWLVEAARPRRAVAPPVGPTIAGGARNTTLASLAGTMRRRGMGEAAIAAALLVENADRCSPPLPEAEVRKIAASIARYDPEPEEQAPEEPHENGRVLTSELNALFAFGRGRLDDDGNALRFARDHWHHVRWLSDTEQWIVYDGTRWITEGAKDTVDRYARESLNGIFKEIESSKDADQNKKTLSWAIQSRSSARLESTTLRAHPYVNELYSTFDSDRDLLCLRNGTIDLSKINATTGTFLFRANRYQDLITKICNVSYDPSATCPMFDAFLTRIFKGDAELIRYVLRALGYSMTGYTGEKTCFLLHGDRGENGKSTLCLVVQHMLGEYADKMDVEVILEQHQARHPVDIAALRGKRFIWTSEPEESRRLNISKIKDLVSSDSLRARMLYQQPTTFKPRMKLWIPVNKLPPVESTGDPFWARIATIPFDVKIPREERIQDYDEVLLREESSGIFNRMLSGLLDYQQRQALDPTETVKMRTKEYREENDPLVDFLSACCVLDAEASVQAGTLYESYCNWCDRLHQKPRTRVWFGRAMADQGFRSEVAHVAGTGGKARLHRGVRLTG